MNCTSRSLALPPNRGPWQEADGYNEFETPLSRTSRLSALFGCFLRKRLVENGHGFRYVVVAMRVGHVQ